MALWQSRVNAMAKLAASVVYFNPERCSAPTSFAWNVGLEFLLPVIYLIAIHFRSPHISRSEPR